MRLALALAGLLIAASASASASMVKVPGGEVSVGSERGKADERPRFTTRIAGYALDRTEVTVKAFARFVREARYTTEAERFGNAAVMTFGTGQWRLVNGANWHHPLGPEAAPAAPDHPVTQVSWNDATAYCAAQGKRLPTEVEMEHAATLAAGAGGQTNAGGVVQAGRYRANVWTGVFPLMNTAKDGFATTAPVGSFGVDALGLADLAGNVWEWTQDWYRPYTERNTPWPQGQPGEKVQRGGSFLCDAKVCSGFRPTARGHASPESALMHVGFRCARSLATP